MTIKPDSPSEAQPVFPKAVRDSTSTAAAVYAVLETRGPLTYGQLADETGTSRTAVENALTDLRDRGVIESGPDPDTPRRKVHDIADSFDF